MTDDLGPDAIRRIRTRGQAIAYATRAKAYLRARTPSSTEEALEWAQRAELFAQVLRERRIVPDAVVRRILADVGSRT